MGGGGAEGGISHPFSQPPSAVPGAHPYAFLQPLVHQRGCARGGHPGFSYQGCGGACSTSISGLLQPSVCRVEDLGVVASGHRPLHPQSLRGCVALSDGDHPVCSPFGSSGRLDGLHRSSGGVPPGPVHPESRPFLRFVSNGQVYQFKALCFGLSTAPQVFSQVMAPVSAILHSMGIRMRRYLNDWLVQSSSRESLLWDLQTVLRLCHELGVVINPEKSHLIPSQVVQYLGVVINAQSFVASPLRLPQASGCLCWGCFPHWLTWFLEADCTCGLSSCASTGHGIMSTCRLLWIGPRSVFRISSDGCLPRLSQGVSLRQVSPDLDFWSDASDVGWGAHLGPLVASGLWDLEQASLPINSRELLAIQHGLLHFQSSLCGQTVAVFCDNVTAVAHLCKEGGTRSPLLNTIAQGILRWSESLAIRLAPSVWLSLAPPVILRPPQITVARLIFLLTETLSLRARTPSSSPGTVFRLTPPFAIIPRVLAKLQESRGTELLWLRIGNSTLGFWTSSSGRWPLRSSFQIVPTSCSCLDLGSATRVSTGYGFMPGDSPAVHQSCRFLVCGSRAGFLGAPSIFACRLPAPMVCLQILVPFSWPFSLSPFPGEGG